jgi:putative transposase
LQERRDAYKRCGVSVNYHAQAIQLPEIKVIRPELNSVHSQILQDVLRRLDNAFAAFFRRIKAGEKPGYPRFRSRLRYDSFTYLQSGFSIEGDKLRLSTIGRVKIQLHRLIEGKVKSLTISCSSTGKWYACFSVEVESIPLAPSDEMTGIDCGLTKFATLSNGETIENPRFFRQEEKALAKAQRKLSVAPKGTVERTNRRTVVARVHERIGDRRNNFAHQLSRTLVNRFGVLIFEKLNIKGMLQNGHLSKSITDAAGNQLIRFTSYKAEETGRVSGQVNPRRTSKLTAGCGEYVNLTLSDRVIHCPRCHSVKDRDHNAAINIERLGLQSLGFDPRSRFLQGAE